MGRFTLLKLTLIAQRDIINTRNIIKENGAYMNRTGFYVIIITILSKIIGFVREQVLSSVYGASVISDAFVVATTIPAVIMGMVATSVTTGYIPAYNRIKKAKGEKGAKIFTYNLMTSIVVVALSFLVVGVIKPEIFVKILASSFTGEAFDLTVRMTRISILCLIPLSILSIHVAFLNANKKFLAAAVIGIPMSAVTILFIYISKYTNVYFLAVGIVLSYTAQFFIVYLASKQIGFKYEFHRPFFTHEIKHMLILVLPLIIGTSAYQINTLVDRTVASGLGEGAISSLNYALRINGFIQGVFITTLLTVMYPIITEYASNRQFDQLKTTVRENVQVILFIVIPLIVGGMIYSRDIVKILFMRGAFDQNALDMTSTAMYYYLFAMLGVGLREIFFRIYYAMENNKKPMYNAILNVILNIILNLVLSRLMGIGGLALATTLTSMFCAFLMYYQLRREIQLDADNKILFDALKVLLCGISMAYVLRLFNTYVPISSDIFRVLVSVVVGAIWYLALSFVTKVAGLQGMIKLVQRKINK